MTVQDAVRAPGAKQADARSAGDDMALAADGFDDLANRCLDQQTNQATTAIAALDAVAEPAQSCLPLRRSTSRASAVTRVSLVMMA